MDKRVAVALGAVLTLGLASCDGGGVAPGERPSPTPAETPGPQTPSATPSPGPGDDGGSGGRSFSFAAIGDFGTGSVEQLAVAARMCRWERSHHFEDVITTGDNVYPSADPALFQSTFFSPYSCLFDRGVEWHATLGNHDWDFDEGSAVLAERRFGMRAENYVVRRPGVRFVLVNSNDLDRKWLASHLEADDAWTVVAFHHPVYSPGLHGPTPGFEDLHELFVSEGVDLVLNGHDHFYAAIEPRDGIRYVVTGGGGARLYPCLPSAAVEVCELEHHFLYVTATPDELVVRAVPTKGPPFHVFSTEGIEPGG